MELHHEKQLLSCCYLDNTCIDKAIQYGITEAHFSSAALKHQWQQMTKLHTLGLPVEVDVVYSTMQKDGTLEACGGISAIMETSTYAPTTLGFMSVVEAMHTAYSRTLLDRHVTRMRDMLNNGAPVKDMTGLIEQMGECLSTGQKPHRTTKEIAESVLKHAEEQIAGKQSTEVRVFTGLPTFDKWATPIMPHEYVVVGGRTSHGKSSLMAQIAMHNIYRGLRVAYYTIETSAEAVLRQIASQRAHANARFIQDELPDRRNNYLSEIKFLAGCNRLMIFDNVLTLDQLQAHGRMLASSFKPELVVLDYLNIIGTGGTDTYEKMSTISRAMIPFRKSLGCALLAGAQLNRESEKDNRKPQRTDLRDSGTLEEDAHRIIAVWRKPNQALDNSMFDCEILQLKLRDGPLAGINAKFAAAYTKFIEESHGPSS